MTNLQKAIQREISCFKDAIELDGGSIPEVDKSSFCKARKKLKPTAFVALSDIVLNGFYSSDQVRHWKGYRLIAFDGSTMELPNSKAIQAEYGVFKYSNNGKATCMGRALMAYDTINHMTLHGSLAHMDQSESAMLWECLPKLQFNKNDLLLFDRYYASYLLFFYLQHRGVQFCFRMKKDWWKVIETFYNSGSLSSVTTLELPKNQLEEAQNLGITATQLKCRLTRIELEGGETEILLSTLTDEQTYSIEDTKELYGLRWPVEDAYKTFKHKVCIENFSGKSPKFVLQDFYVKLFIMNLTAVAIRPVNEALKKEVVKVKYRHQVNVIEAVATLKRAVVSFFITKNIGKAIKRAYERFAKCTEPIRPGRKFPRNHQRKRKHYMNYKPV